MCQQPFLWQQSKTARDPLLLAGPLLRQSCLKDACELLCVVVLQPGFWSGGGSTNSCTACPTGLTSQAGAPSALHCGCEAGYGRSTEDPGKCDPCDRGTWSAGPPLSTSAESSVQSCRLCGTGKTGPVAATAPSQCYCAPGELLQTCRASHDSLAIFWHPLRCAATMFDSVTLGHVWSLELSARHNVTVYVCRGYFGETCSEHFSCTGCVCRVLW